MAEFLSFVPIPPLPPTGTLLAVQFVHAVVNRIIPTSNGFIAPSRHGYLIRERFQCPSSRISQQDPLKNFKKAVWMVRVGRVHGERADHVLELVRVRCV